jgi:hypothetical protein
MITILDKFFFKELRKLGYDDEMRYKLMIYGIKRILGNKKKSKRILGVKIKTKPKWD